MNRSSQASLEEEIRKAQSKFDEARRRNQELKSTHIESAGSGSGGKKEGDVSADPLRPGTETGREKKTQAPAPEERMDEKTESPVLSRHSSFEGHSFSPEPGFIEELKDDHLQAGSEQVDASPSPPQPTYPDPRATYPPYGMMPPAQMYGGQQFYMPYPQQFDMQGYARQMIEFFHQFLPQSNPYSTNTDSNLHVTELNAEIKTLQQRVLATEEELIHTQRDRDELMTQLELGDQFGPDKEEEITELRRRLADSLERTASLERTIARERDLRLESDRRSESLKSKLNKFERISEELKLELQNTKTEAKMEIQELNLRLKKAQRDIESLCKEISTLRSGKPASLQRMASYTSRESSHFSANNTSYSSLRESPEPRKSLRNSTETLKSERSARLEEVKSLENELMKVQIERDMAMVEMNKLPEQSKSVTQRRRREELDEELEQYAASIDSLKLQLRSLASKRV